MKKNSLVITSLFFLLISFNTKAQSKTGVEYFAGKWSVFIPGTPYGDLKRIYVLDKSGDGLTGIVQDGEGKEITKCSKVEVKDTEVTLYYQAQGTDISITLAKKDEDHVTGSVLGVLAATGERIKKSD